MTLRRRARRSVATSGGTTPARSAIDWRRARGLPPLRALNAENSVSFADLMPEAVH
jgi:hypothetical protein